MAVETWVANTGDKDAVAALTSTDIFRVGVGGVSKKLTYAVLLTSLEDDLDIVGGGGGDLEVGVSEITSGTTTRVLYNNAGVLGEYTISGSGTVVAMATSPSFTTPALGAATGTSIVLSDKLEAASIELGHASANTLTASGGTLSIEGVAVLTASTGQPLDSDLTSWAAVTRASGFDTFVATPSSANLIALLTDETGTGAAVFANTPTLVTPVLGAATGTSVVLSGKLEAASIELGHASANTLTASGGTLSIEGVAVLTANTGQPLDSDLTSWAGVTRASGFDTFAATPSLANLGSLLTDDAAGLITFMTTPSSANFATLVTDETGSGALVFGTSPTFTTGLTTPVATITQGTITDPAPQINGTVTWNDAADTFTAWKLNVTNTNSAAASLLMDLQVGDASFFKVFKDGAINFNATGANPTLYSATNCTIAYQDVENYGIWLGYGGTQFASNGVTVAAAGAFGGLFPGVGVPSDGSFCFSSEAAATFTGGSALDVFLRRDAADTLALRNSTTSETFRLYDTYTSSTDYHRVAIKTARATLASVNGATVTATALIPDGAVVVGVTTKVTVTISGGTTTGFQVGTGGDPDRWGEAVALTAGTSLDNTNWTAGTIEAFTAATDVIVTAVGGNFTGTGTIYLSVQYLIGQCD
jgi:hypothetical protein